MSIGSSTRQRRATLRVCTTSVKVLVVAWLALLACSQLGNADAAAVMSVDLGTEWMKVGVVSPGVPMEIALNRESKRKTPAILAFRDGVRSFGEDAVTVGIRDPASAYGYLLDLLGKTIDNPIVDLYRERFPYYDIEADPERKTLIFKKSDTEQFSVEELVAQMLVKAKEFGQESTSQPITECVLTVPGYFGQAEREALLAAAQLANLKVLQLINDYTAVALNYGVFHRAEINETAQYFIFYDMGAYKTSAALVSFQLLKDKQTKETNPVVQVLGVGYDRTLGGLEIQLRLRDYLAAEFNAMKKTTTDVTKSPRALAKLFKEAGRVKNVLSANNDHYAQIENLLEDHDFKLQVTREKLEELCADMWPRLTKPIEQAVEASGLSLELVSQVILFGGGTRVPKVQELIKQAIQQEPGKSLNADEAATMGAVYKAADLATGFKVKKFVIRDAVLFPLQVTFERDTGDAAAATKQVKRVLFGPMNAYPQKKVITFNKHTRDFDFNVHYGDLSHLGEREVAYIGGLNISRVELQQVQAVLERHQQEMLESKGIKAYFVLDDSGIFRCTGVEFVYEKQKVEAEDDDDEGTLAKLGSTISKLFSKDDGKDTDKKEEEGSGGAKDEATEKDEEKSGEGEGEGEQKDATADDAQQQSGKADEPTKSEDKDKLKPSNETVKVVTVKEPMQHKLTVQFTSPLAGDAYTRSHDKLAAINKAEFERTRLESAFNTLESHVIETQRKLGEEEYASCISGDLKEQILKECAAISDWLYEDHDNPTPELYEKRLGELKQLTDVFLARHWEHEERPEALKALASAIQDAKLFLESTKNFTKDANPEKDVFTQVEIETLAKVIAETGEWRKTEEKAQKKLKRHDEVRLTVKDITDKIGLLEREIKYMANKFKIWKQKAKPTKKDDKKTDEKKTTAAPEEGDEAATEPNANANANEDTEAKADQMEVPQAQEANVKADGDVKQEQDSTPRSDL